MSTERVSSSAESELASMLDAAAAEALVAGMSLRRSSTPMSIIGSSTLRKLSMLC